MVKQEYKHKVKKLKKHVLKKISSISVLQSFMDKYKRFNLKKRSRILSRITKRLNATEQRTS